MDNVPGLWCEYSGLYCMRLHGYALAARMRGEESKQHEAPFTDCDQKHQLLARSCIGPGCPAKHCPHIWHGGTCPAPSLKPQQTLGFSTPEHLEEIEEINTWAH